MKRKGIYLISSGVLGLLTILVLNIYSEYQYERDFLSYWNLSQKASTIEKKAMYIDRFVAALQHSGLSGESNALFLKTVDNSFDKNLDALVSLKNRLDEIAKMNVSSLEYQMAIQQITAQEQGEAGSMLGNFESIWCKRHYLLLWDWIGTSIIIGLWMLIIIGLIKAGGGLSAISKSMKEAEANRRRGAA